MKKSNILSNKSFCNHSTLKDKMKLCIVRSHRFVRPPRIEIEEEQIRGKNRIPNDETIQALEEDLSNAQCFHSVDDLLADLRSEN